MLKPDKHKFKFWLKLLCYWTSTWQQKRDTQAPALGATTRDERVVEKWERSTPVERWKTERILGFTHCGKRENWRGDSSDKQL